MRDAEKRTLADAVYHRFVKYQEGMNLITVDVKFPGLYKAVAPGKGTDTNVPVNYLNSLEHIDSPTFLPDLNHDPTLRMIMTEVWGQNFKFDYYKCPVWNEEGWRIIYTETSEPDSPIKGQLTHPAKTKEVALLWSLCVTPPF